MKFDITEERQKNSQTHYIATIIISKKKIKKNKIKTKKNTQKQKITRHYQLKVKSFFLKKTNSLKVKINETRTMFF